MAKHRSKSKSPLAAAIIAALVLALLFALNPTTEDFQAWRSTQAQAQAGGEKTSGLIGALKSGAGKIAGAMTGLVAGSYSRKDYFICSTFSLGNNSRYLGVARLFIKLK
jgi:hypothetical protein